MHRVDSLGYSRAAVRIGNTIRVSGTVASSPVRLSFPSPRRGTCGQLNRSYIRNHRAYMEALGKSMGGCSPQCAWLLKAKNMSKAVNSAYGWVFKTAGPLPASTLIRADTYEEEYLDCIGAKAVRGSGGVVHISLPILIALIPLRQEISCVVRATWSRLHYLANGDEIPSIHKPLVFVPLAKTDEPGAELFGQRMTGRWDDTAFGSQIKSNK